MSFDTRSICTKFEVNTITLSKVMIGLLMASFFVFSGQLYFGGFVDIYIMFSVTISELLFLDVVLIGFEAFLNFLSYFHISLIVGNSIGRVVRHCKIIKINCTYSQVLDF